jgi:sialate O-acetylesterase
MKRFFFCRLMALGALIVLALPAAAQVQVNPLFTDNMVLQQRAEVPVWGKAAPGATVTIKSSWTAKAARATADADGHWSVTLTTPRGSFRKHSLTISDGSGEDLKIQNVLVGEVWFCSGQSNMQMPMESWQAVRINQEDIANAGRYPDLRLLQVSRATGMSEREDFAADFGGWQPSSPETVRNFSAIAWYFGRKLQERLKVPVGLIHSSWGGTIIEAWMSAGAIRAFPELREKLADVKLLAESESERERTFQEAVDALMRRARDEDAGLKEHWEKMAAGATLDPSWRDIALPNTVQTLWPAVNGVYWFRKEVEIPAEWAGKDLTLSLGPVDDFDETFWDGVQVGSGSVWNLPRSYTVPGSAVKAGKAVITIRNTDDHGNGGLYGAAADLYVEGPDGKRIPLDDKWKVKLSVSFEDIPVNTAREPNLMTVLYNAMVRPLAPYRIAGVIWYQGESNAVRAARYRDLMPTMITDWRRTWGYDFPFYITQIANHHAVLPEPTESAWAELREAQSLTALHLKGVEQACIIDLGEADDVHPVRKQEAGERLSLLALSRQYGARRLVCNGPRLLSYKLMDGAVELCFGDVAKGLCVKPSGSYAEARYGSAAMGLDLVKKAESGTPTGFQVAGPDGVWHWAEAQIVPMKAPHRPQTVIVSSPDVPYPTAVRYGWADNPVCNLFNTAGLPMWPFRTDVR